MAERWNWRSLPSNLQSSNEDHIEDQSEVPVLRSSHKADTGNDASSSETSTLANERQQPSGLNPQASEFRLASSSNSIRPQSPKHASLQVDQSPVLLTPHHIESGDPMQDDELLTTFVPQPVMPSTRRQAPPKLRLGRAASRSPLGISVTVSQGIPPSSAPLERNAEWWQDIPNEVIQAPLRTTVSDHRALSTGLPATPSTGRSHDSSFRGDEDDDNDATITGSININSTQSGLALTTIDGSRGLFPGHSTQNLAPTSPFRSTFFQHSNGSSSQLGSIPENHIVSDMGPSTMLTTSSVDELQIETDQGLGCEGNTTTDAGDASSSLLLPQQASGGRAQRQPPAARYAPGPRKDRAAKQQPITFQEQKDDEDSLDEHVQLVAKKTRTSRNAQPWRKNTAANLPSESASNAMSVGSSQEAVDESTVVGGSTNPHAPRRTSKGYQYFGWSRKANQSDTGRSRSAVNGTPPQAPTEPAVWEEMNSPRSIKARLARGEKLQSPFYRGLALTFELNPKYFSLPLGSPVYVVKSTSIENIRRSLEYGFWSSSEAGNQRLQVAFETKRAGAKVMLMFSMFELQDFKRFCGLAEMCGPPDHYPEGAGLFEPGSRVIPVRWIYCKDVSFGKFAFIFNPEARVRPVTSLGNARCPPDTQGRMMVKAYIEAPALSNIMLPPEDEPYLYAPTVDQHRFNGHGTPPKMHAMHARPLASLDDTPVFASMTGFSRPFARHDGMSQPPTLGLARLNHGMRALAEPDALKHGAIYSWDGNSRRLVEVDAPAFDPVVGSERAKHQRAAAALGLPVPGYLDPRTVGVAKAKSEVATNSSPSADQGTSVWGASRGEKAETGLGRTGVTTWRSPEEWDGDDEDDDDDDDDGSGVSLVTNEYATSSDGHSGRRGKEGVKR